MLKPYILQGLLWLAALPFEIQAELNTLSLASVNISESQERHVPPQLQFLNESFVLSSCQYTAFSPAGVWLNMHETTSPEIPYQSETAWNIPMRSSNFPLFSYFAFDVSGSPYEWVRSSLATYPGYGARTAVDATPSHSLSRQWVFDEDHESDRFWSEFFVNEKTKETWKNKGGLALDGAPEGIEIRATAMPYLNEGDIGGELMSMDQSTPQDGFFYVVAANIEFTKIFVLTELSRLEMGREKLDTRMFTSGIKLEQWLPFVGHSALSSEGTQDGDTHNTWFAGARWDIKPGAALKLQYDQIQDAAEHAPGDRRALSLGLDVMF